MKKITQSLFILSIILTGAIAAGVVFKKPDQALKEGFKDAGIEIKNVLLDDGQIKKIEDLSKIKIEDKLVSFYIAKSGGSVEGDAYIDTHLVRTKSETAIYFISAVGEIDNIIILSFGEPPEYMPTEKWLALFAGKALGKDALRLRQDIPNMTGATMTAKAIIDGARKALALWKVLFGEKK
ncbi:MAG: FMN-binding protein [Deltaproteobacteria bacterium]|nr:FMN-binding protein [Deltaproteobacteria bacterium]